ncbi:hypothetical protein ACFYT3_20355 [Nocardia amikacinitolerans]|uniref:hypothetical protein n=1 Tax=Nocardia amikacinitolerans TaxID=756689 RepID=UPI0036C99F4A
MAVVEAGLSVLAFPHPLSPLVVEVRGNREAAVFGVELFDLGPELPGDGAGESFAGDVVGVALAAQQVVDDQLPDLRVAHLVEVDHLLGGALTLVDEVPQGRGRVFREVAHRVQDLPREESGEAVAARACADDQLELTALLGVVQQPLWGQVRQGDALGGQRAGHVEQGTVLVTFGRTSSSGFLEEPFQQWIFLRGAEVGGVVLERVDAEPGQRRCDHAHQQQAFEPVGHVESVVLVRGDHPDRFVGVVQAARLPSLLPRTTGEPGQVLQQYSGAAAALTKLPSGGGAHRGVADEFKQTLDRRVRQLTERLHRRRRSRRCGGELIDGEA